MRHNNVFAHWRYWICKALGFETTDKWHTGAHARTQTPPPTHTHTEQWQQIGQICLRTYLLTYLLTAWNRVLLERLTGFQPVKKFPAFHGTRRSITAFTSARQLSLSWVSLMQYIPPHPTSWRFILMLSSHLRQGLPSALFPSGFPTKTLYTPLLSPIRATCPAHFILLDFISRTILGEEYRSLSSSLCSFLHSPFASSLLGPNIPLNTLFSNTLSLRSSLNVSDQVSHPYQTTGKITILYILIF